MEKFRYEVVQNVTQSPVVIANLPAQGNDFTFSGWAVVDLTRLFKPEEINRNQSLQNAIEKLKWLKVLSSEKDVILPTEESKPLASRMKLGDKIETLPNMYSQMLMLQIEKEEMQNLLELSKAGTATEVDMRRLRELQNKFKTENVMNIVNSSATLPNPLTDALGIFKDRAKFSATVKPTDVATEPSEASEEEVVAQEEAAAVEEEVKEEAAEESTEEVKEEVKSDKPAKKGRKGKK